MINNFFPFAVLLTVCFPALAQLPQCGRDYEPVLLPIVLPDAVQGAFGSTFSTELLGFNAGDTEAGIWRGCDVRNPFDGTGGYSVPPNTPFTPRYWGDTLNGNPGVMLHIYRAGSPVQLSLRLRISTSSSPRPHEIELPVVRETEFRTEVVQIFPVTPRLGTRSLLRIYDPKSHFSTDVVVRVYTFADSRLLATQAIRLDRVSSPATADSATYGQLYLDSLISVRDEPLRVEVVSVLPDEKLWAFVSTTDNETQGIALVTPR